MPSLLSVCLSPALLLLQVKAGSIFDNILLTDSFATAKKFAEDTWGKLKEAEKKMFDTVSEVRGLCNIAGQQGRLSVVQVEAGCGCGHAVWQC